MDASAVIFYPDQPGMCLSCAWHILQSSEPSHRKAGALATIDGQGEKEELGLERTPIIGPILQSIPARAGFMASLAFTAKLFWTPSP